VLVAADRFDEPTLVDAVLVPLLLDGSAVLVQGAHDDAVIAHAERALTRGRW
jgi:hypothetical protein